jgi:hypothetical protein
LIPYSYMGSQGFYDLIFDKNLVDLAMGVIGTC